MATISIAGIEADAEKALAWVAKEFDKGSTAEGKVAAAAPSAIAGLGTVMGTVGAAISSAEAAAAGGLSLPLDAAAIANIKAVWPSVTTFLASLGIKL